MSVSVCTLKHTPFSSRYLLSSISNALCLSSSSSCRDLRGKQTSAQSCQHPAIAAGHDKNAWQTRFDCRGRCHGDNKQPAQCFEVEVCCYGARGFHHVTPTLHTKTVLYSWWYYTGFYCVSTLTPPWGPTPQKPRHSSHGRAGSTVQSCQGNRRCLEAENESIWASVQC